MNGCITIGRLDGPSDQYGGCYGLLQKNISDFLLAAGIFPFHHHNITHGVPIAEWPLKILSAYNCSIEKSKEDSILLDSMDTFKRAFEWNLWLLILSVFFTFSLLFTVHYKLFKAKSSSSLCHNVWTVITFSLQQDSVEYNQWIGKLLSFLLSVFIFLITTYFCNLMSTDQVSVKQPKVIKSYDDLTESIGMRPIFWSDLDDYSFFQNSKSGTGASRLWSKVKTMPQSRCMMKAIRSSETFNEMGKEFFLFNTTTFIMTAPYNSVLQAMFCSEKLKSICTYETTDLQQPFYHLYGFLIRQEFEMSKLFRQHLKPFLGRCIENGFTKRFLEEGPLFIVREMGTIDPYDPTVSDCLSKSIVTFPSHYDSLRLVYLKKLFMACFCIMVTAWVVLKVELRIQQLKLRPLFDPSKVKMSHSYHRTVAMMKQWPRQA